MPHKHKQPLHVISSDDPQIKFEDPALTATRGDGKRQSALYEPMPRVRKQPLREPTPLRESTTHDPFPLLTESSPPTLPLPGEAAADLSDDMLDYLEQHRVASDDSSDDDFLGTDGFVDVDYDAFLAASKEKQPGPRLPRRTLQSKTEKGTNYQVQNMAWQYLHFLRKYFDVDGEAGAVKSWEDGDFHALHDHSGSKMEVVKQLFMDCGCFPA
jgi:hypothetical protein